MSIDKNDKDIFTSRWVIIGIIVLSLLIPLLSGCGVKGDLKRPPKQVEQKR